MVPATGKTADDIISVQTKIPTIFFFIILPPFLPNNKNLVE